MTPDDPRSILDEPLDIADDGFTDRVMRAIPQRRAARGPIVLGCAAAACAASYALTGQDGVTRTLAPAFHAGAAPAAVLAAAMAILIAAAMAAVAAEE